MAARVSLVLENDVAAEETRKLRLVAASHVLLPISADDARVRIHLHQ
jgi:hypothetical protein